jgi:hypothetical protein
MIARLALVAAALAAWGFLYPGAAAQGRNASPKDTVTDEGLSASAVGDEDEEQDDNEEDVDEEEEEDDEDEGEENEEDDNEEDDDGDDEEDEDAPSSPWTFSGIITRALLPWNDGAKRGLRIVDNPQDSSGFGVEGEFDLGKDWTAGTTIYLDTYYGSADTVHQRDLNGSGTFIGLSDAYFEIGHEKWGELVVGLQSSATDEIDSINLAESDMVADASVSNWNSSFFLRRAGPGATLATGDADLRWGDFLDGPLGGSSGRFVTYISPDVLGFEASASIGRPESIALVDMGQFVFDRTERGMFTDAALRYSADWGETFRVSAGIGIWKDTSREWDADEPTNDRGWGGSLALMHIPTGLNIAGNFGTVSHTKQCAEPGEVSGRCRGADRFIYTKGGIVRDLFTWGPTAFYGEYYKGWKAQHESDHDVLRFLEVTEDLAEELKGSVATVWGAGVAQTINPTSARPYTTELYLGYRRYELDLHLIGSAGPVPARQIKDFNVVMAGLTIRWGDELVDALGRSLGRSHQERGDAE